MFYSFSWFLSWKVVSSHNTYPFRILFQTWCVTRISFLNPFSLFLYNLFSFLFFVLISCQGWASTTFTIFHGFLASPTLVEFIKIQPLFWELHYISYMCIISWLSLLKGSLKVLIKPSYNLHLRLNGLLQKKFKRVLIYLFNPPFKTNLKIQYYVNIYIYIYIY